MNDMGKFTTLSVRFETAERLKKGMKYGEKMDSRLNWLLDIEDKYKANNP